MYVFCIMCVYFCLFWNNEIIIDIVELRIKFIVLWYSRILNIIYVDYFIIFCYIFMDRFVYIVYRLFFIFVIKGINFILIIGFIDEI